MSDDSKKYNGYTNYETWAVNSAISNEESLYNSWKVIAKEFWHKTNADYELAKEIESYVKDVSADFIKEIPIVPKYFIEPLLMGAISEVNWIEVALSLLENMVDEPTLKKND